jgi:tetratricopeptide (TPR) repeat protein
LGKYEKSVEEAKKVIELDPDVVFGYNVLAWSYQFLDRQAEAETTLQRAAERKLEMPDLLIQRYDIAFLRGDKAGMERAVALSQGKSDAEDLITALDAFGLAYSGHLQQARRKSQRAVDRALQSAQRETAALFEAGAAVREAFFGIKPAARQSAMAALKLSKGRDVEYGAAFALALSGDVSESPKLARDLETRFPEDTAVRFSYVPALRALLALNQGEPAKAVEQLRVAIPYELGTAPSSFFGFFGTFYPIYLRGEAYLAANRGAEAAAEFQKILDHRAIVFSDPIGALARLQLGRAFALSGDKIKAKAAYQDSSPSGKTPTPTSRSSSRLRRNTPSCGEPTSLVRGRQKAVSLAGTCLRDAYDLPAGIDRRRDLQLQSRGVGSNEGVEVVHHALLPEERTLIKVPV